jgi:hypothetical protein
MRQYSKQFVPETASLKPAASVQKLPGRLHYSRINRYARHSYLRNDFSDTRNDFLTNNANMIDKKAIFIGVVACLNPVVNVTMCVDAAVNLELS